jgi:rubrerythrin
MNQTHKEFSMQLFKGINLIRDKIIQIPPVHTLSIIGDPGCDGLGAATMSIFARALTAFPADLTIVAGDLVHRGIKPLYASIRDFINTVALSPVLTLCGNHDTAYYDEYFGLRNYAVTDDKTLLIFLDNSKRLFEPPSLDFLKNTLSSRPEKKVLIFFHIPLANPVSENTVSPENSAVFLQAVRPHQDRIRYFFCGHVHSYYEAEIEGIRMIVTGGGGARIELVSDKADPSKGRHHVIRLTAGENTVTDEYFPLDQTVYRREIENTQLKENLDLSFHNEAAAHLRYRFFAEHAQSMGFAGLAKMFRAFADSEYYHAKNHFYSSGELTTLKNHLSSSRANESFEVETFYREFHDFAVSHGFGLAAYSFLDSLEAEKIHHKILQDALQSFENGHDLPATVYHTCTSCGYTFSGDTKPAACPVCGAPHDKITEVI